MPRISLVTPTYNQASTIRETIESVLRQEGAELEYWVFDGGSRDGTLDILRDYEGDPRFHWISEPDGGQSDALNKGLARCTGEIFNWINSDDYLEPGALRLVAETFAGHPPLDIVSGRTAEFRGAPACIFNHTELQLRDSAEAAITVGVYCQPSTFWRIELVRALGGVDPSLHCVMDWNLWVRYLARYGQRQVRRVPDLLAHYRHHAEAKTCLTSNRFYEEAKGVFHNLHLTLGAPEAFLLPEVERDPGWQRREFELGPKFDRERYLGAYADRMVRLHRRKNPREARAWLNRAWAYPPGVSLWRIKMALRLFGK